MVKQDLEAIYANSAVYAEGVKEGIRQGTTLVLNIIDKKLDAEIKIEEIKKKESKYNEKLGE